MVPRLSTPSDRQVLCIPQVETFQFEAIPAQKPLLKALHVLRQMNRDEWTEVPPTRRAPLCPPSGRRLFSLTRASTAVITSYVLCQNSV